MNLRQFQEESRRTMPFKGSPGNTQDFERILGNYSMGLVGEVIEAFAIHNATPLSDEDIKNFKKELGDVSHYAVGFATLNGQELPEHIEVEEEAEDISTCEVFERLIDEAGSIVEHAKKVIYHRHAYDPREIDVIEVLTLTKLLAKAYGFKYSDVLQTNINKLKVRYPETFNTKDSIARADICNEEVK